MSFHAVFATTVFGFFVLAAVTAVMGQPLPSELVGLVVFGVLALGVLACEYRPRNH